METKFQTSFIPKKPNGSSPQNESGQSRGASLVMTIGMFLFILSLLTAGGAYGWTKVLESKKVSLVKDLNTEREQFKPEDIARLKQTNTKIDLAEKLVREHSLTSLIFDKLAHLMSDKVRFTSLDITSPGGGKPIAVALSGYGLDYETVAWQSDILGQLELYSLRNVILNPVVTNPVKNPINGLVTFDFSANINPDNISYEIAMPVTNASTTGSLNASTTAPTNP